MKIAVSKFRYYTRVRTRYIKGESESEMVQWPACIMYVYYVYNTALIKIISLCYNGVKNSAVSAKKYQVPNLHDKTECNLKVRFFFHRL